MMSITFENMNKIKECAIGHRRLLPTNIKQEPVPCAAAISFSLSRETIVAVQKIHKFPFFN
jgi:hypothetical protein